MVSELILHPAEASAASRDALRTALAVAAARSARLLVLGAVSPYSWSNRVTYGSQPFEPETSLRHLEDVLRWRVRDAGAAVPVEYRVVEAEWGECVIHTAAERRCSLLVMARPDERGWPRLFRTAAERVISAAPCPVLLVPKGGRVEGVGAAPGRVA